MTYYRPFTPQQRRDAMRTYRSFRKHLSMLRREYPPATEGQRGILEDYREAVRAMLAELEKSDRQVDVDALNAADAAARWYGIDYFRSRPAR